MCDFQWAQDLQDEVKDQEDMARLNGLTKELKSTWEMASPFDTVSRAILAELVGWEIDREYRAVREQWDRVYSFYKVDYKMKSIDLQNLRELRTSITFANQQLQLDLFTDKSHVLLAECGRVVKPDCSEEVRKIIARLSREPLNRIAAVLYHLKTGSELVWFAKVTEPQVPLPVLTKQEQATEQAMKHATEQAMKHATEQAMKHARAYAMKHATEHATEQARAYAMKQLELETCLERVTEKRAQVLALKIPYAKVRSVLRTKYLLEFLHHRKEKLVREWNEKIELAASIKYASRIRTQLDLERDVTRLRMLDAQYSYEVIVQKSHEDQDWNCSLLNDLVKSLIELPFVEVAKFLLWYQKEIKEVST